MSKKTSKKTIPAAVEAPAPEVPAVEVPAVEVPAPEVIEPPAPEAILTQAEAAYGKEALDALLTSCETAEDFLKADFEPAVLEEIYRRLKPKAKVSMPKSTAQSPCKLVWHIASAMPGAKREAVIAECVAQGISPNTAKTQYQHWKKAGQVVGFQLK